MLRKYFLIIGLISSVLVACNNFEVLPPEVEIMTNGNTYKVGDSVEFIFRGESDVITFYSGESGKEYRHRERTRLSEGNISINMETQVLYGSQSNNLRLFLSQDFNGSYTPEGIDAATWIDISDRLQWSTAASGAVGNRLVSPMANIQDLIDISKPLYFAYKYTGLASTTGAAQQRTWRIYEFNVYNTVQDDLLLVTNRANAGWRAVNYNGTEKGKWELTANSTMIYYNPESNLLPAEQWAITKALDPFAVNPDNGEAIKSYSDNMPKTYKYVFTKPGTYVVTFVFVNSNFKGYQEVVKEVTISIEE